MTSILPADLSDADLREICKHLVNAAAIQEQLNQADIEKLQVAEQVAKIVQRNFASGRAQRVMANHPALSSSSHTHLEQYVNKVILRYLDEHQRVERLAERDDTEWTRLQGLMTTRAYKLLQYWQAGGLQPRTLASDFAQLACESIFGAIFPYDVPFDAWATVILNNLIRQRYTRSQDLMDRNPAVASLDYASGSDPDETTSPYESLGDPTADQAFAKIDTQLQIVDAIAQLQNHAQQDVIVYTYLYGWSDDLIAEHLGKSKQAIYNLRHRALQHLRKTWGK